jgi:shikimate kinase
MVESVVLIGPMGVGKTTIGKKLARQLNRVFIDTDKQVVKNHGSIPKLFEKFGEQHFRNLESEYLAEALDSGGIIATGGGVVITKQNRELLSNSFVIYLSSNGTHMASRLLAGRRPLLKNGIDDWWRIYEERKPLYKELANLEVETSGKPLGAIVTEIVEVVRSRG